MNWTDPQPGNNQIAYDHVTCDTPLGRAVITWKSWKENPVYDLELNDEWIGSYEALDVAKAGMGLYLTLKHHQLSVYLQQ